MNMGKKYVIRLVITTLASIVLMVLMLRATDKALEDSIEDLSGTSAAVADIVYGMKMDQVSSSYIQQKNICINLLMHTFPNF